MPATAAGEPLYFIDHDGRLFLIENKGALRLPTRAEVPFGFVEKHRAQVRGRTVVFAAPTDKHHREDWRWKDDLTHLEGVDDVARTAANMSQTRVVAKGAFFHGDKVLVIKDCVGFYKGRWSLPGGYLDYGESPAQCAARELEEETGVVGEVRRIVRVDSQVVPTGFHFITFHFEGRALTDQFKLKEDEVEDARWATLEEALRDVASPHSRRCLEDLLREGRGR